MKSLTVKQINKVMIEQAKKEWQNVDDWNALYNDNPFLKFLNPLKSILGEKKYKKLQKTRLWKLTKD